MCLKNVLFIPLRYFTSGGSGPVCRKDTLVMVLTVDSVSVVAVELEATLLLSCGVAFGPHSGF